MSTDCAVGTPSGLWGPYRNFILGGVQEGGQTSGLSYFQTPLSNAPSPAPTSPAAHRVPWSQWQITRQRTLFGATFTELLGAVLGTYFGCRQSPNVSLPIQRPAEGNLASRCRVWDSLSFTHLPRMWETYGNRTAAKSVHLEVLPLTSSWAWRLSELVTCIPCACICTFGATHHMGGSSVAHIPGHTYVEVSGDDLTGPCLYFLH